MFFDPTPHKLPMHHRQLNNSLSVSKDKILSARKKPRLSFLWPSFLRQRKCHRRPQCHFLVCRMLGLCGPRLVEGYSFSVLYINAGNVMLQNIHILSPLLQHHIHVEFQLPAMHSLLMGTGRMGLYFLFICIPFLIAAFYAHKTF